MKKFTALILTFVLLFSLVACRKEETKTIITSAASTVFSTACEASTVTKAHSSTEARTTEEIKTEKPSATVKFIATEAFTTVSATAEKKTRLSTTRRNYFPSKASTTEEQKTEKETSVTTSITSTTKRLADAGGGPTVPKSAVKNTCTISINCSEILKNTDSLKKGKESFVPSDGKILETVTVEFSPGETVFDVLKRACGEYTCTDCCQYCRNGGIQLEYEFTPGYDNYYIEGIHQIYEKDCGSKSGWMYKVNGVFPNYGCSDYELKSSDNIEFVYTVNLGEDVGAEL